MSDSTRKDLRNAFFILFAVWGMSTAIWVNGDLAEQEIDGSIPVGVVQAAEIEEEHPDDSGFSRIEAQVTAYSEIDSCHTGPSCLMASGKKAYVGAAACPRAYEFGTKIQIMDQEFVCEDRTALRYDGRFDLFKGYGQEAYDRALNFGNQKLMVLIEK